MDGKRRNYVFLLVFTLLIQAGSYILICHVNARVFSEGLISDTLFWPRLCAFILFPVSLVFTVALAAFFLVKGHSRFYAVSAILVSGSLLYLERVTKLTLFLA
jgi:hypothetical protein